MHLVSLYLWGINNGRHNKDNDCILIQTTYTHRGTFFGKATVNIPEYQKEIENDERKLNSFIKYNDYFYLKMANSSVDKCSLYLISMR